MKPAPTAEACLSLSYRLEAPYQEASQLLDHCLPVLENDACLGLQHIPDGGAQPGGFRTINAKEPLSRSRLRYHSCIWQDDQIVVHII